MPSVDQSTNKSNEMATISSSLEAFETYKDSLDKDSENRDSDEDSFHLTLTDDEADTSTKLNDTIGNGVDDNNVDVLNEFEYTLNKCKTKSEIAENVSKSEQSTSETVTKKDENDESTKETENTAPQQSEASSDNVSTAISLSSTENKNDDTTIKIEDGTNEKDTIVTNETRKSVISKCNINEEQKPSITPLVDYKCDSSNDSSEMKHLDCDDLMDVTIVRDADEDNAESERNAANQNKEESEYDDQNSDKMEEEDESETGREEVEQLKNDEMEIIDDNHKDDSDMDNDDKMTIDDTKDIQTNDDVCGDEVNSEIVQKTSDSNIVVNGGDSECAAADGTSEKHDDKIALKDLDAINSVTTGGSVNLENDTPLVGGEEGKNVLKRQSSDDLDNQEASKKQKVDENIKETKCARTKEAVKSLSSLKEFLKNSKNGKRLTLVDLEQFCLQKICEGIVHQSDLGDLHHQLKVYEQAIEAMRREMLQLMKQSRDLEIVNKKLLNELKQHNATQKPLQPLKITRSVGLQVKFTPTQENVLKRRQSASGSINKQQQQQQQQVTTPAQNKISKTSQNTIPLRQNTSPAKTKTPLLNQALTATTSRRSSVNATPSPKPTNKSPEKSGIIDLTDEDDKNKVAINNSNNNNNNRTASSARPAVQKATSVVRAPLYTPPTTIRFTTQGKTPGMTTVVSSSPQLMYVVQSAASNVLGANQKTVLLNLQPTNGVLATPTLNGQSVSVIPTKQANSVQLKPVSGLKSTLPGSKLVKYNNNNSNKHPAPLPPPPHTRILNDNKVLKPIPPKPSLTVRKTDKAIILQWKMPYDLETYEAIASYQIYAYQETSATPSTEMWRRVGDVKALALPMACTLTEFADNNKYYFAVRPVDVNKRFGAFSEPEEISL